jgi:hypothetical protein
MTWLVFMAGGVEVGRCIFHGAGYPEAVLYGGQLYTQTGVSKDTAGAVHLVTLKQAQVVAPDMGPLERVFDRADLHAVAVDARREAENRHVEAWKRAEALQARVEVLERQLGEPGYVDALRGACEAVDALLPRPAVGDDYQLEGLPDRVRAVLDGLKLEAELQKKTAEGLEARARGLDQQVTAAQRERDTYRAHLARLGEAVEQRREAIRHQVEQVVKNLAYVSPESKATWLRVKLEGLADPVLVNDARTLAGVVEQLQVVPGSNPQVPHVVSESEIQRAAAGAAEAPCTPEKPCAICSGGGEACEAAKRAWASGQGTAF